VGTSGHIGHRETNKRTNDGENGSGRRRGRGRREGGRRREGGVRRRRDF
jgi:hypothetical protein